MIAPAYSNNLIQFADEGKTLLISIKQKKSPRLRLYNETFFHLGQQYVDL